MSDQSKKIWFLAAAFLVIAPMSIAGGASSSMKWVRLLTTVGIFYFSFKSESKIPLLTGSKALITFIIFFALEGLWSDAIKNALIAKGMLFFSVSAGISMVYCVKSTEEMLNYLKFLGYVGGASSVGLIYMYRSNPEAAMAGDRLAVEGMNPNTIGSAAAPLLILSLFLLFKPDSKLKRGIHLTSAVLLLAVILMTGSRGALLMAALGALFVMKPILKKNMFTGSIALLIPLVVFQMFGAITGKEADGAPGMSRLNTDDKRNTRAHVWEYTYKKFEENKLIGKGWLHWGSGSMNTHNIYLHVLAETGIVGALIFASMLFKVFGVYREDMVGVKSGMDPHDLCYFAIAILSSMLLHGMVESSTLLGTSTNALFLGFSVALLDRALLLNSDNAAAAKDPTENLHPWAFQRNPEFSVNKSHQPQG